MRYLIINAKNYRLCKDNKFREFACFGTYEECVKIYKQKKSAMNKIEAFNRFRQEKDKVTLLTLQDGDSIDASGRIFQE